MKKDYRNIGANRLIYLDVLRIMATFAVIVIHVNYRIVLDNVPVKSYSWNIGTIYHSIMQYCLAVFCMISGALLLDTKRQVTIKKIFTHNILRICTAYLFWSAAYAIVYGFKEYKTLNFQLVKEIISRTALGHYHLWFCFMIVGFYLTVPVLRTFSDNKKILQYFIILAFLFEFQVNIFKLQPQLNEMCLLLEKKAEFHLTLGYTGYFVLGHYLNVYGLNEKRKKVIYILGISSVVVMYIGRCILSKDGYTYEGFFNSLLPTTCFWATAVFLWVKDKVSALTFSKKTLGRILCVSKVSFGIYLVHIFVLSFIKIVWKESQTFNAVLSIPIVSMMIFVISFFICSVISKIPLLNKYLI